MIKRFVYKPQLEFPQEKSMLSCSTSSPIFTLITPTQNHKTHTHSPNKNLWNIMHFTGLDTLFKVAFGSATTLALLFSFYLTLLTCYIVPPTSSTSFSFVLIHFTRNVFIFYALFSHHHSPHSSTHLLLSKHVHLLHHHPRSPRTTAALGGLLCQDLSSCRTACGDGHLTTV